MASYKIVEASSIQEALKKSELRVGQVVVISDLLASSAGPNKYSVIPQVRKLNDSEEWRMIDNRIMVHVNERLSKIRKDSE